MMYMNISYGEKQTLLANSLKRLGPTFAQISFADIAILKLKSKVVF